MTLHYVFCNSHWSKLRLFFQNALVDHIGVCTVTNDTQTSVASECLSCNQCSQSSLNDLTNKINIANWKRHNDRFLRFFQNFKWPLNIKKGTHKYFTVGLNDREVLLVNNPLVLNTESGHYLRALVNWMFMYHIWANNSVQMGTIFETTLLDMKSPLALSSPHS